VRRPWAASLAFVLNFGLLPLIAWGFAPLLQGDLAIGLLVATAAPCTLASAAVWTRRAGGNDAVALLVMVATNLTCFLFTPLILLATTGRGEIKLPVLEMMVKLGLLVVVPIVLAQLTRLYRPVARWTTRCKTPLSTVAQLGILSIVLIGAVQSAHYISDLDGGEMPGPGDFVWMIVVVSVVHTLGLAAGHLASFAMRLDRPERIAVGFSGSQKTLMVGIYVATTYFPGTALLPMIAYHVSQLVIDTLVADRLKARGERG
jgi:sodium/bile acid cotransporter 7